MANARIVVGRLLRAFVILEAFSSFGSIPARAELTPTSGITSKVLFLLDVQGEKSLALALPERELVIVEAGQPQPRGVVALSAKFLPSGEIVFIDDELALMRIGPEGITRLLPPHSANAPLFVSRDGKYLAYLKPKDFDGGSPIPSTNGLAAMNLERDTEHNLFEIAGMTIHLYGWVGDRLVFEAPSWSPATLKPSDQMVLHTIAATGDAAAPEAFAALPALAPGARYPQTSFDQRYLAYESRQGVVVASLETPVHFLVAEAQDPLWERDGLTVVHDGRRDSINLPEAGWDQSSSVSGEAPLPGPGRPTPMAAATATSLAGELLYRPVAANIAVSAYYDLDRNVGTWRDWLGYTGTNWIYGHAYDQHEGTDYDSVTGEPILASLPGMVTSVVVDCANTYPNGPRTYGTNVRLNHGTLGDGHRYETRYAHLKCDGVFVGVGAWVTALPHVIAEMGNTGWSTGDHVHLNVYRNGSLIDPYDNRIISDSPPTVPSNVDGMVKDANGQPVSGAEVKFSSGVIKRATTTDGGGHYLFEAVPTGAMRITAVKDDLAGAIGVTVFANQNRTAPLIVATDCIPPLPGPSGVVSSCAPSGSDRAAFVADVTLPDGTLVSPSQALVKTWRMSNTGAAWGSGYHLVFVHGDQMGAPAVVNVPPTASGQTADISLNLTAPQTSGDHLGYWRLRNPRGTYFGPAVYWQVNSLPPGGHITTLAADPPSPSSASRVRIHVRAQDFPNFRAVRLRIDGAVVHEADTPEFYYDWNTSGYAAIDHNLVVEVADQTDMAWSRPERRGLTYTLQGTPGTGNYAPDRPRLVSPPDWSVASGAPPPLCAQGQDPDGDPLQYQFEAAGPLGVSNSGWVNGACYAFGILAPGTFVWQVKTRDGSAAESGWSDGRRFSLATGSAGINQLDFEPLDANGEQFRIRACASGLAGSNPRLSLRVNDATDGSDGGQWHVIGEGDTACFDAQTAPIWNTLAYADGTHRVRVVATAISPATSVVSDTTYTLTQRRPPSPDLLAPTPLSGDTREAIYLNSRTITFRWGPAARSMTYTLHLDVNPSPKDNANPVFRQTFGSGVTQHTVTVSADYPVLYWQVSAANDMGTQASGDQLFGIDRGAPSCAVQSLSGVTAPGFQVSWNGSDNLAGVNNFSLQYLDSGRGSWRSWLIGVPATQTSQWFAGQPGHTYSFRCRAADNANNVGSYPAQADTSTAVPPTTGAPDLTVLGLAAYPSSGGGALAQAVIRNVGSASTQNGFYTDLYLDRVPTGVGDYAGSVQLWVNEPIEAGATLTLTTVVSTSIGEDSVTLYAQVDSTGAVAEADEGNNIYAPGVPVCLAASDAYEGDDTPETAKPIVVGPAQAHNFGGPGDRDWVTFAARGRTIYTLRTSNLAASADTYVSVYSPGGVTPLASNDDQDNSLASQITWVPVLDGTYYAMVRSWNPHAGGCGSDYTLSVLEGGAGLFVFLPLGMK